MSTPSDTFEDRLREQLHSSTPGPYAGLDPAAVIGAGERVVRRRRLGTALVAAVVVAAVAVGANALGGHRPLAAPVPAAPSTNATSGPGIAHLTIAQNGQSARHYTVTLLPDPDKKGGLRETWRLDGSDGTVGGGVEAGSRRATWGFGGDPFVLGLVPDEGATSVSLATTGDFGEYTSAVEPVPGTGWSAFVLAFDKPLTGTDPVGPILWIDHLKRPVDGDGNVGSVTTLAGRSVWLTHDGAVLGVGDADGVASTPMPGTTDFGSLGAYPRVTMATDRSGASWDLTVRLRPEAVSATLVLTDGRRIPVTPVRLGDWSVAVVTPISGAKAPELARVEWTTAAGVDHDDPVPALTATPRS